MPISIGTSSKTLPTMRVPDEKEPRKGLFLYPQSSWYSSCNMHNIYREQKQTQRKSVPIR